RALDRCHLAPPAPDLSHAGTARQLSAASAGAGPARLPHLSPGDSRLRLLPGELGRPEAAAQGARHPGPRPPAALLRVERRSAPRPRGEAEGAGQEVVRPLSRLHIPGGRLMTRAPRTAYFVLLPALLAGCAESAPSRKGPAEET